MSYCNGSDMLLYLGEKAMGHCTTHTTTLNSETKDRAVKPIASKAKSSGLWKEKGVTGLLILTEKGRKLKDELHGICTFEKQDIQLVVQGQMATPPQINWFLRKWVFKGLNSKMPMDKFYKLFFTLIRINRRLKRIFS